MKKHLFSKKALSITLAVLITVTSLFAAGLTATAVAGPTDLVISECDTLTGWNKTGGGGALSINANGFGSTSAVHSQVNSGAFRTVTYTTASDLDISNHTYIEWDAMFYTQTVKGTGTMWEQIVATYGTAGNNQLYLKIGSSAGGYRIYRLSKMQTTVNANSWVHFRVAIDDFNTESGSFDPTALETFYFSTTDGTVSTDVNDGFIRLDNIYTTGYQAPVIQDIILSECETTTDWTYGGASLSTSASGVTGSALYAYSGMGMLRKLTYTAPAPVDLSSLTALEWDMTALNASTILDQWGLVAEAYTDTIGVEISDGTLTKTYSLYDFEIVKTNASWWHFGVDLAASGLDLSNITSFSVYVKAAGSGNSAITDTIYKLDNLTATANTVTPNGYNYAAVTDKIIDNCESLTDWTYRGNASNPNFTINVNGAAGSAIQVFAGMGYVGPIKRTFQTPVNISRHGAIGFALRCMPAGQASDYWPTVAGAYEDYIEVTLTDATGVSYTYGLSEMVIEPGSNSWYNVSVDLSEATTLDMTQITSFSFRVTDTYQATSLSNVNLRIDSLSILAVAPTVEIPATPGDANGDEVVDVKDLVVLKRHLAQQSVTISLDALDLNGDGDVDSADLICLRKQLLGISFEQVQSYTALSNEGWGTIVKS